MTRPALGCEGIPLRFCRVPAYMSSLYHTILEGQCYSDEQAYLIMWEKMTYWQQSIYICHFSSITQSVQQILEMLYSDCSWSIIPWKKPCNDWFHFLKALKLVNFYCNTLWKHNASCHMWADLSSRSPTHLLGLAQWYFGHRGVRARLPKGLSLISAASFTGNFADILVWA